MRIRKSVQNKFINLPISNVDLEEFVIKCFAWFAEKS